MLFFGLLGIPSARSQEAESAADRRYPVPPERSAPAATWAVAVDFDLVFPVHVEGLCPTGTGCVGGAGAGASGWVERRLPRGFGFGFAYDVWFLDGGGVLDTTVAQSFGLGVRYVGLASRAAHPTAGVSLGLLLLGESFRVATHGGYLDVRLGVEAELTPTTAFEAALGARLLTTAAFTTPTDGARRSAGFEVDAALFLQVGLVFLPAG